MLQMRDGTLGREFLLGEIEALGLQAVWSSLTSS